MREGIIIGLIIGAFFAAMGAVLTALAIKNATPSMLWDMILWSGVAVAFCSIATLALYISAQSSGRQLLWPALLINSGICLIVGGLVWHFSDSSYRHPISFQKLAIFWVNIDPGVYQIGVAAKFFNSDDRSYLVNGMSFVGKNWAFFPRGSYYITNLIQMDEKDELLEDNYIKPNDDKVFKKLLPVKFGLNVNGGETPDFVLRGEWRLIFGENEVEETPRIYSTYVTFVTLQEWNDLTKPQSQINIDSLYYKPIPAKPAINEPENNYLVYALDRTAVINNPYFAQTISAKGSNGVMVFIRGAGLPPLEDTWTVLGHTYAEVWSDPKKLALYNSIFPPEPDGHPRPFGFFAGLQNEMAGSVGREMSAPTTRAADILEFDWSSRQASVRKH